MNSSNTSPLKIILWNANGVTRRKEELRLLLTNDNIDVALITETHLRPLHRFSIPGYTTYRTDFPRDEAHGGTAIILRCNISHYLHSQTAKDSFQVTSIVLPLTSYSINLSSVYCSPSKPVYHTELLSTFLSFGTHFIAGGDFNAKHPLWGSRTTSSRGRIISDIIQSQNFSYLSPNNPTYWPSDPNRTPDVLDFFIASGLGGLHSSVRTLNDLSSDHSPVLLCLGTSPQPRPQKPTLTPGKMNWKDFQTGLENSLNLNIPLKTAQEVDLAVMEFTKAIQDCALNSCRPNTRSCVSTKSPLPEHIRNLLVLKRRARARWQRTRYPSDRFTFNRLTQQLKSSLSEFRSRNFDEYLESLTKEDNSLWNATRKILHFHSVPSPIQLDDGTWARSDEEKAFIFASHLETVFTPHPEINPNHSQMIYDFLETPLPLSPPPKAFNPSEIKYVIKSLKLRKAPGPDLITPLILKNLPHKAICFLTYIYNAILRTTHFPTPWKNSSVIMIHKPNKPPTSPSSYRPISLLPIMSKVFEKLLYKRIIPFIDSSNSIPTHQFGFRSHHSTTQQCFRVVDKISEALERKFYCTGVFLDVAQAFDRVWHPGLVYKLKRLLPFTYYLILKSYLTSRSFQVQYGTSTSLTRPVLAGVPQGSILGPLLYILYTADFPTHPENLTVTFADDTAILSSSPDLIAAADNVQEQLLDIETWCNNWRIQVNPSKCTHVNFTLKHDASPPVYINDEVIPESDHVKYLGFHLDKRLTWNMHTKTKRTELNRRYGLLRRILGPTSKLSTENKLTLYKTILRPIWTYGIELWGTAKQTNVNRIQAFQSKTLRRITNAPFYVTNETLHRDLNIPYVSDLSKSRFQSFHEKLSYHPNPEGRSLSTPSHPNNPPKRLKRCWPRDQL